MGEDRGRKAAVVVLFVVALLGVAAVASILVKQALEEGTGTASRAGGSAGADGDLAASGVAGRRVLPGVDDVQTFEAKTRPVDGSGLEEDPEGDGAEEDPYTPPERYDDPPRRAQSPPADGSMPTPPEDEELVPPAPDEVVVAPPPVVAQPNGNFEPTVVAVIDNCFDPYHYDFLASQMPQATDADPANDLPLGAAPNTWLPGWPAPGPSSYTTLTSLDLGLAGSTGAVSSALHTADAAEWGAVAASEPDDVTIHWIPGTKVIGFVQFGAYEYFTHADCADGWNNAVGGLQASSLAVGNKNGACPECILVFVNGRSEEAVEWVNDQAWIDVQVNAWSISQLDGGMCDYAPSPQCLTARERIYAHSDVVAQKEAVERGQAIFFMAGDGAFEERQTPTNTILSSQSGPDWIITVGGAYPTGAVPMNSAQPSDIGGLIEGTMAAGPTNVMATVEALGSRASTAVVGGIYARALHNLRTLMEGNSRIQDDGVISIGELACGSAIADCATDDSAVTVHELREALMRVATPPVGVYNEQIGLTWNIAPFNQEYYLAATGHGYYLGRYSGALTTETNRVTNMAKGTFDPGPQDVFEYNWMENDSWCRQYVWGEWGDGYWDPAAPIPVPMYIDMPLSNYYYADCDRWFVAVTAADAAGPR